jgi:hypothetical protein
MADDLPALHDLLVRVAPEFDALDGAAVRANATGSRAATDTRVRRFAAPAAAAALVIGLAVAITLLVQDRSQPGHSGSAPSTGLPKTSPVSSRRATPHPGFQLKLVLPATRFPADGRPIKAHVLAINHTGGPVKIRDACNGWVLVGLAGMHNSVSIASGDVRCAGTALPIGTTRVPVVIRTTYSQCQQGKRPGTPAAPHCLGPRDSRPPNLPPGSYRAEVKTMSTSSKPTLPRPQQVILTSPR